MPKQLNVNLAFSADTRQLQDKLLKLQEQLKSLALSAEQSTNGLGLTEDLNNAILKTNELRIALESATTDAGKLDLGKFNQSLIKNKTSLADYADALASLGPKGKEAFSTLAQSIITAEVPLKRTSKLLTEFSTTLKNAARWQISSSILHGFMSSLQSAYSYAQDLDSSLNDIRIVTGESSEEMAIFAQKANKAAQELSTTTTKYTDAALIFYQQGLDDDAVKDRTDTVIKMSNVTKDSAEDVSSYMTAIWENFYDGSKSLEYYADVITRLGADTAASSAEIAEGLESFASIGDTIGLSYEYATSALTTIVAKTRASASEVGNGLRTIFSRLQNLSLGETLEDGTDLTKYTKALATVGVNIKDASGELKSMDNILDDLASKWNTLDQAEKTALANTVGGVRQYTKLIALMDNWDFMKKNIQRAENSKGSLQEQADIYADSWESAQKRVKAAWQKIYSDLIDEKIFISFSNGIETVLQGVDGLISAFGGLQSIIPFIGSLLLKTFGNDVSESIDRVFYNIYQGSEIGKEQILNLRKSEIKNLAEMQEDGTAVGAAQVAVYAGSQVNQDSNQLGGKAGLEEALLQKTQELEQVNKNLTEEEQKQVQLLLDQNDALGNEYINITKNLEAKKESAEQEAKNLLVQYKAKEIPKGRTKDVEGFEQSLQKIKNLQKQYSVLNNFVNRYEKTITEATKNGGKDFDKIKASVVAYAKSLQEINPDIEGLSDRILELSNAKNFNELETKFDKLKTNIDTIGVKAYKAGDNLRELGNGVGISNIDNKVDSLLQNFGQLGTLTDNQIQAFANFNLQVDKATGIIQNLDGSTVTLAQGFTTGVQAVLSYAAALSQAQQFGEQLFNQDTSFLQKLISGFMLLSSTMSAANNITEASVVISAALQNAKEQETLKTAKQIVVEKARLIIAKLFPPLKTAEAAATTVATVATEGSTVATENNTKAVNKSKLAILSHPILGTLALAISAIVAIISVATSALERSSEKIAENAKESRDAASASKEITDANQEQIDSYNEVYQTYLKDKTAKNDLVEVSKNVCDQLDIENAALLQAKGDYEELTKAIYNYQDAQIKTALQKNQRAQNDTSNEFVNNMKKGDGRFSEDKYIADIGTMWQNVNDETIVQDAIANLGDQLSHVTDNIKWDGTVKVETGQSTEELKEAYEEILAVVEETERLAGNNTELLNNSENYQAMLGWLDKSKDSYEALIALEDEEAQLRTQQIINSAMAENQSISTMEEYKNLRQEVIDSLQKEIGLDSDKAIVVADTYLKQSAAVKDLAQSYSILQDVSKKTGIDEKELNNFYNQLNPDEQKIFISIDFDTAKSINDLNEQLDVLQARANKTSITSQFELVNKAKDSLKENMSSSELLSFEKSSGIDWGNEEQGIIKYSDFLKMNFQQQTAYLDQLSSELKEKSIQSSYDLIQKDTDLLAQRNQELEEANQEYLKILGDAKTKNAENNLQEAKNALTTLQAEGSNATEAEIANAKTVLTKAQQDYDDITGEAKKKVEDLQKSIGNLNSEIANTEEEIQIRLVVDSSEISSKMNSATSLSELQDLAGQYSALYKSNENGDIIGEGQYDEYAAGLLNIAQQYDSCSDAAQKYQNALNLLSQATDENQAELSSAVQATQEHLEVMIQCEEAAKKYGLESDTLSIQMREVASAEGLSEKQALALTIANQRMNKGISSLNKNWTNWKRVLSSTDKTSQDYAEALGDISDAVQDLIDWYGDLSLDSKFVEDNMEIIEKAAKGDTKAILALGAEISKYTVQQAELNSTLAEGKLRDGSDNAFQKYIQSLEDGISAAEAFEMAQQGVQNGFDIIQNNLENLQNGTTSLSDILDLDDWVSQLNAYAAATGTTAEEMQKMLSSVGVTAHVKKDYQEQDVTVPSYIDVVEPDTPVEIASAIGTNGETIYSPVQGYKRYSIPGEPVTAKGFVEVASISMDESGADAPVFTGRSAPSPSATKGNSGSGGGGSKKTQTKNSEKHIKKRDEEDRYHVIKNQIEDLTAQYDRIGKAKDKAFGPNRIKLLDQEIAKQKELTAANKKYLEEVEQYQELDKGKMVGYGAIFDKNGTITNYDKLLEEQVRLYNEAVDKFNEAYTDDEGAKAAFEAAKERYEQFKEDLDKYEESQDLYKDQLQAIIDAENQERALRLEKTQAEVELKVNVSEDSIEYLDYALNNIENKAYDVANAFALLDKKTATYFEKSKAYVDGLKSLFANQGLTDDDFNKLLAGDVSAFEKIKSMLSNGENAGFTSDDIEAIRDYVKELISTNEELQEVRQTVHDQLLTVWDEWNDKMDTAISKIEHLQNITSSYKNIIDIVGQKSLGLTDSFMSDLSQKTIDQANNKLQAEKARYDSLKQSRDEAFAKYENQKNSGILSEEEVKMWEDNLKQMDDDVQSAAESFQSAWEDALNAANEEFENSVQRIIDAYSDAAAGLMGSMSELQEAFDRGTDLSDQYLDDYEKIYQFSKLNRDIQESIDSTDSVKAKKELLALQSKINAYEESGVEISEYQMDYLRKEYELKKAQIDLEESQNAKSQVKMQRDNEGNYSYVYTANDDDVAKAEQNYEDKLHEMQVANADYIKELQGNMVQMEQDYQDKVQEIMTDTSLTAEERMVKLNEVNEYYDEKMKYYISEAQVWQDNSSRLYDQDWKNYSEMTGYKISAADQWIDKWKETQLAMLTGFSSLEEYQQNHDTNVANLLLSAGSAFSTWQTNIETAMNSAGTSIGTFGDDATETLKAISEASKETKDSVVDMAESAEEAINGVTEAITNWEDAYSKVLKETLAGNEQLINSFNELLRAWSGVSSLPDTTPESKKASTQSAPTPKTSSFDTGGYTGSWGADGKFALLHEKELILNAEDTKNFLTAIDTVRQISEMIDLNALSSSGGLTSLFAAKASTSDRTLQQEVTIHAEFPNVEDKDQISAAFNDLVNLASQYANRK